MKIAAEIAKVTDQNGGEAPVRYEVPRNVFQTLLDERGFIPNFDSSVICHVSGVLVMVFPDEVGT
jgi:hypothetical protein